MILVIRFSNNFGDTLQERIISVIHLSNENLNSEGLNEDGFGETLGETVRPILFTDGDLARLTYT